MQHTHTQTASFSKKTTDWNSVSFSKTLKTSQTPCTCTKLHCRVCLYRMGELRAPCRVLQDLHLQLVRQGGEEANLSRTWQEMEPHCLLLKFTQTMGISKTEVKLHFSENAAKLQQPKVQPAAFFQFRLITPPWLWGWPDLGLNGPGKNRTCKLFLVLKTITFQKLAKYTKIRVWDPKIGPGNPLQNYFWPVLAASWKKKVAVQQLQKNKIQNQNPDVSPPQCSAACRLIQLLTGDC